MEYRYGFNGKEKDTDGEWGSQTHYDYGFRIYNPTIGRFLSVDPLTGSYPWYTPYQFAGNKPINSIDLDGLEERIKIFNVNNDNKVVTTIWDGNTLKKSVQVSGSFAISSRISKEDWVSFKTSIWNGFSGNEKSFARGYKSYTLGLGGNTDTDFTGINKGTLTIGAGVNGNILIFDPIVKGVKNDVSFSDSFSKGAEAFNVFFINPSPLVARSQEFKSTFDNYVVGVTLPISAEGLLLGASLLERIASGASLINGFDDLSGNLTNNGNTFIQNNLGNKFGNMTKTYLGLVGLLAEH